MSSPTTSLLSTSQLIKQGAEAKVYKANLHPAPLHQCLRPGSQSEVVLLKYRFPKQYRHKSLDTALTKARVVGEARALMKCLRSGVSVPGIRMVDAAEGVIGIEWIEGQSIRVLLGADDDDDSEVLEGEGEGKVGSSDEGSFTEDVEPSLSDFGLSTDEVMILVGVEIAKMHLADVVHGDLTTSNMMLRRPSTTSSQTERSLVLIDFGLSYVSSLVEDKAVDLYVLERAFSSTHPNSEFLFQLVLKAYAERSGKAWEPIQRKLEEVRLRGRKRSMVG